MKLTIRYTAGDPARECVEVVEIPDGSDWENAFQRARFTPTLWQRIKRALNQPTKRMTGPNVAPPPAYGKPPCTPHGQGTK